jgi:hypothetical protein
MPDLDESKMEGCWVAELESRDGSTIRRRAEAQLWRARPSLTVAPLPPTLLFHIAIALAFVVSVALRGDAVDDVSWLITMCERIVNGERAYVDIFETTPPVPVMLYMPGVLVARLTGLTPEAATFGFAYASTAVSLWISGRILPEYVVERGQSRWLVLMPAAVVLLILPRDEFAQREYFAAAFSLPVVSVFIRHAQEKQWPALSDRLAAAALGGVALAIKPPIFALPGVFVACYYWWRTRSLSFLLPSGLLAAGVIGLVLTAVSLMAFPDYLGEISIVMREVYVPIGGPAFWFLHLTGCLGVLFCLTVALILSVREKPPVAAVLTSLAATGFLAAYLIQRKYWYYHIYPAALFAAITASILVFRLVLEFVRIRSAPLALASVVYLIVGLLIGALFFDGFENPHAIMRDLSWAENLHHPRALAISPTGTTSFPLARRIDAAWVGRTHSQWIAWFTRMALQSGALTEEERRRYLYWHERDLRSILREIREKTPELIFTDTSPDRSWLKAELSGMEPGFLDPYQVVAEQSGIGVLRLKALIRASPERPSEATDRTTP